MRYTKWGDNIEGICSGIFYNLWNTHYIRQSKINMMRLFFCLILSWITGLITAQTIQKYYDFNWKETDIAHARFFAVIKYTDSGWVRNDFFLNEKQSTQMMGKYADSGSKIKNGFFYYFYPDGNIKQVGKYLNDKKEGLWLSFHQNGMMSDSSEYKYGGKTGICKSWYANGFLKDSMNIGETYATVVSWYDDGQLSSAGRYNSKDKLIGSWQFFHQNGQLASQERYDIDGNLLSKIYYSEAGVVMDTGSNKDTAAAFVGGINGWSKYLQKKLLFPRDYQLVNADVASVVVDFTVNEDGSVGNVQLVTPFFKPFNDIAVDVIKKSPKWKPATSHNRRVKYDLRQSVTFTQSD